VFPPGLVGQTHLGAHVCEAWELRVTARCLREDLNVRRAVVAFDDLRHHDIVKALVRERSKQSQGRSVVSGLTCKVAISVLRHGDDHRGGTLYDQDQHVVWLVAYGWHRSGHPKDFFPYCRALDAKGRLLPTQRDYERLIEERALRFAYCVRIEAPLTLRTARAEAQEQRVMLGGEFGACISVEVAGDVEETTVAMAVETVPWDYIELILTSFHATPDWMPVDRMPSRPLDPGEIAFSHLHEV
jgi:hypothetical protein